MKKTTGFLLIIAAFILFCSQGLWAAETEDRYIVKFKDKTEARAQLSSVEDSNWQQLGRKDRGIYIVDAETAALLTDDADVAYIEKDSIATVAASPNDTAYVAGNQWALSLLNAETAWDITTGSKNVTVAVIDSGFYYSHEDNSSGNIRPGLNYIFDGEPVEDTTPTSSHGSMVAGIIAATTNNNLGMAGAVWDGDVVMMHTVYNARGESYVSDIAQAVYDAIGEYGADVINISSTTTVDDKTLRDAIAYAYNSGVIVVAAAGNYEDSSPYARTDKLYPAAYEEVVSVGSVNKQQKLSAFSQANGQVDVVAPGESIYSLSSNGRYAAGIGTSYAAPYVAALAALALAVDPDLTPYEFEETMQTTSTDLGNAGCDLGYNWRLVDYEACLEDLAGLADGTYETGYGSFTVAGAGCTADFDADKLAAVLEPGTNLSINLYEAKVNSYSVRMPAAALDKLIAADTGLEITTRLGSFTLPAALLAQSRSTLPDAADYAFGVTSTVVDSATLKAPGNLVASGVDISFTGGGSSIGTLEAGMTITLPSKGSAFTTVMKYDGSLYPLATKTAVGKGSAVVYRPGVFVLANRSVYFADIGGHWAEGIIKEMANRFIVNGVTPTAFAPNQGITRAEFAALLVRSLGLGESGSGDAFSDVPGDRWYYGAVYSAYANDIVHGIGDGKFNPDAKVTREEAMMMIANALPFLGMDATLQGDAATVLSRYGDGASCSFWAQNAAALLTEKGLIQGDRGNLYPHNGSTRAEAVKMLHNLLKAADLI